MYTLVDVIAMLIFSATCAKIDASIDYMPAGLYLRCDYNIRELRETITPEEFQRIYYTFGEAIENQSDIFSERMLETLR